MNKPNIKAEVTLNGQAVNGWNYANTTMTRSGPVIVEPTCFSFMVYNTGDVNAEVNGIPVFPGTLNSIMGDAFALGGHKLDIYRGTINVVFTGALAGNTPRVLIVQLFYTQDFTIKK